MLRYVFMVGRFIGHGGKLRNMPTVRFGNISRMPLEPISHPESGIMQECFLVECHSISGYSGSPVLVQIKAFTPRPDSKKEAHEPVSSRMRTKNQTWLLGVDFGHMPHYDPVVDARLKPHPDGRRVRSNPAMMAVVPAWKLKSFLLEDKGFMEQRKEDDEQAETKRDEAGRALVLDAEDEPEFTKEDFENALKKASRKLEPEK